MLAHHRRSPSDMLIAFAARSLSSPTGYVITLASVCPVLSTPEDCNLIVSPFTSPFSAHQRNAKDIYANH